MQSGSQNSNQGIQAASLFEQEPHTTTKATVEHGIPQPLHFVGTTFRILLFLLSTVNVYQCWFGCRYTNVTQFHHISPCALVELITPHFGLFSLKQNKLLPSATLQWTPTSIIAKPQLHKTWTAPRKSHETFWPLYAEMYFEFLEILVTLEQSVSVKILFISNVANMPQHISRCFS